MADRSRSRIRRSGRSCSWGWAAFCSAFWIKAIIDQSLQRRELIDRLEAAQTELAAAERREGVLEERQRSGARDP